MNRSSTTTFMVSLAATFLLGTGTLGAQDHAMPGKHTKAPFTEARFDALQKEGALVLVEIYATWCPVCAQQQKILSAYREEHPDVPLHTLVVDFDTQKDLVKRFKAPRQSTFILFKKGEQVWFSVADTRKDVIFEALNKAAVAD